MTLSAVIGADKSVRRAKKKASRLLCLARPVLSTPNMVNKKYSHWVFLFTWAHNPRRGWPRCWQNSNPPKEGTNSGATEDSAMDCLNILNEVLTSSKSAGFVATSDRFSDLLFLCSLLANTHNGLQCKFFRDFFSSLEQALLLHPNLLSRCASFFFLRAACLPACHFPF